MLWGNVKATELANRCPDTLDEAPHRRTHRSGRVGSSYQLCFNFLDHTGLRLCQYSLEYQRSLVISA